MSVMDILDLIRLVEWKSKFEVVVYFINYVYYFDLVMVGEMFVNELFVIKGCGLRNFIVYEEVLFGRDKYFLSSGVVFDGDIFKLYFIDESLIKEEVMYFWY